MRRSTKKVFKFIVLSGFTIGFTIISFKLLTRVENGLEGKIPSPLEVKGQAPIESLKVVHEKIELNNLKIDWHDYERIEKDKLRKGVGEQGKPAYLKAKHSDVYHSLYQVNGFNAALSDKISVERAVPDIRHKGCQTKKYLKDLPNVSVIVPFHNEHWTTLLRTAYSVINRSPPQLLKEVILVDDCSTKNFTKKPLDDYLKANLTKVRVVHLPVRQGLILARMAGARVATGEVLLFLDSHTEANVNWLPPLLEPISQDYKTCVCPFIDVVAYETFEYRAQDEGARGAFDWEFFYKRLPLLPSDLEHPSEPFKSPVMAGGLFAISTKFFWELGGYDEGLDIWGGEQYELSFKIWQCGGQMYDAPCSRVGHIYRKFAPFPNPRTNDFVGKNYRRVAEVWMDEYAQYLYLRRPHYKNIDPGDLTKQRAIREKLKCKPFKWFMENIAFDLPLKYPVVEPPDFATGEIRNLAAPELCVDASKSPLSVTKCVMNNIVQNFTLTWHKDIRKKGGTKCWDVSNVNDRAEITLYSCHGDGGNQYWKYEVEKQWLVHGGNRRCLDCDPGSQKLYVTECDESIATQKWRFEFVNLTAIANWNNVIPKKGYK